MQQQDREIAESLAKAVRERAGVHGLAGAANQQAAATCGGIAVAGNNNQLHITAPHLDALAAAVDLTAMHRWALRLLRVWALMMAIPMALTALGAAYAGNSRILTNAPIFHSATDLMGWMVAAGFFAGGITLAWWGISRLRSKRS